MSKFIIVVRHGELNNPKNIAYNRDSFMDPQDIIHLSELGKKQMEDLGRIIKEKQFKVKVVKVSPETRAQESIKELLEALGSNIKPETEPNLDDNYASGPYKKGMTQEDVKKFQGNVYEGKLWEEFNHEKPKQIITRMKKVFFEIAQGLKEGETGIMLSHGDPTSWLLNDIVAHNIPEPKNIRTRAIYPNKGEGYLINLDLNDRVLSGFSINLSDTVNNKY